MNARPLLNLMMMAVAIALMVVVLKEPGRLPGEGADKEILTALRADAVTKLVIIRASGEPITLQRDNGLWKITAPRELPAEQGRIAMLTSLVEAKVEESYARDYLDMQELGLEPPAVKLAVNDSLTLQFGGTHPLNGQRYVTDGDMIRLIADTHFQLLNADVYGLVATNLLPEKAEIRALTLPDRKLTLHEGRWQLEPDDKAVSADAIETLMTAWRNDRALWVSAHVPDDQAQTIEVLLVGSESPIRFTLSRRNDETLLGRPDLSIDYHLTDESAARLLTFAAQEALPQDTATGEGEASAEPQAP